MSHRENECKTLHQDPPLRTVVRGTRQSQQPHLTYKGHWSCCYSSN